MVAKLRSRRQREPLDVRLSLRFRFGDAPADEVTVMDDRRVPMVGSVLENRDRILRAFAQTLVRVSLRQPKVIRELFPLPRKPSGRSRGR
ncbi:MAG TPA: hypothetical protein VFA70_10690 [Dehalococcoidia bacterium]|nr:hypothetical protein [Dehalococcoidia bacterium]